MKNLAICNTYYQLITLIQLHLTICSADTVDILLSDHSKNAACIANRLNQLHFFRKVDLLESKQLIYQSNAKAKKVKEILGAVTGNAEFCRVIDQDEYYDQLIFFNADIATATIFARLQHKNPKLKCARLEEGIASYNKEDLVNPLMPSSGRLKLVHRILKALKKENMNECTDYFYCYYPQYYEGILHPIKIPLIDFNDKKLKKILKEIFCVAPDMLQYPQKYIYFASIGDAEGEKPIGEVKLAVKLAELVGKDNLLVKVHPRDTTEAFSKAGLNIDKNSSLPWEVIQLNYDFSKHVFVTAISGSVLTISLIMQNHPRIFFLYPLCDFSRNVSVSAVDGLKDFFEKNSHNENIVVTDKLEDIIYSL